MATAIHEEQADEKVLLHYFDTILLPYYSAAEPWIKQQQQGDSSRSILGSNNSSANGDPKLLTLKEFVRLA
jgi:hypothetical protein